MNGLIKYSYQCITCKNFTKKIEKMESEIKELKERIEKLENEKKISCEKLPDHDDAFISDFNDHMENISKDAEYDNIELFNGS